MSLLVWIILFSLFGGVLSVIAAAVFLALPDSYRDRVLPHFVSFAIGTLLGAAFLALLPQAATGLDIRALGLTVLLGLLGFFLLEKMVLWRHCHVHDCEAHAPMLQLESHASGILVLVGDAIHNLVDGMLIAVAFMTDVQLGIITSLAVATHEIPQEVGDFAILLHSGFRRKQAFLCNILVSLTTVVGALIAYFSLSGLREILPYVLAVAAASFIYIAVADLIPGLHKRVQISATLQQLLLITIGSGVIYAADCFLP